ncbi:shikimate dehydrogenase [Crocosphaera sp. XPORK-15E]|uniref:shikimate dehydrogenase n=1 Tax=Crocosphaera sp. XPORK-15E TaxID=3110247 RepID=UPI002B209F76|nr:shikimate dehydrogenase [Crocosphaera sp. XPORK-15E]MEA5533165.1 shikimate dehydrogenase [Crocosphaera sp. XPORK-15E]
MNEPATVTYSIAEVLKRIDDKLDSNQKETNEKFKEVNQKLDKINERLTNLEVGQATLTEKVGGMDKRLEKVENEQATMVKAISDLQGFRSLIVPVVVAVATALLTLLFRLVPNIPH